MTPDPARAESFRELLKADGIACESVDYPGLTKERLEACDLVIADTPEGDHAAVLQSASLAAARDFPETGKPLLGIGYWGWMALGRQGVALGKGYT